nr:class A beta-lactamase [Sphingomonas sp.]
MTSFWSRFGLALAAAGLSLAGASATSQYVPPPPAPAYRPLLPPQPLRPPVYLQSRITALGSQFPGRVGISVKSVNEGWSVGHKGNELYPQQSVSKLWVAITALDAVDAGRVRMDQRVSLTRSDLTLFHQPIAAKILGGGATMSLSELMFQALTRSDNTANDKLMRSVGGPAAVRAMIAEKRLGAIRFYDGERALQSRIAGLIWSQGYSLGGAFYKARNALPHAVRKSAFDRYVDDPYDGASASAIANALARLKRGELLSPASTARLLSVMGNTKTGANRLKGGLKPGWTLSHKTGTGQVLGAVQAGYNDIGVLSAPDGRSYAVAVMIKTTSAPLGARMTMMNNVVRAVIQQHDMSQGGRY